VKSRVFKTETMCIEFENIVAWVHTSFTDPLSIYTFGTFIFTIDNAEDIADFKVWYQIYLDDKYTDQPTAEDLL